MVYFHLTNSVIHSKSVICIPFTNEYSGKKFIVPAPVTRYICVTLPSATYAFRNANCAKINPMQLEMLYS